MVLQFLTIAFWVVASAIAAAASFLAWTRLSRFSSHALGLALAALACSLLGSVALVVRWFTAAPGTTLWPLLAAPLALGCLAVCAQGALWAHSRRSLLPQT